MRSKIFIILFIIIVIIAFFLIIIKIICDKSIVDKNGMVYIQTNTTNYENSIDTKQ